MKQKITFVGHIYVDTEGLGWRAATELAGNVLDAAQDAGYTTHLHVVTKIEVGEDE